MFNNSERLASSLKDFSIAAWKYYQYLLTEGFNEEQALRIVLNWQSAIVGGKAE